MTKLVFPDSGVYSVTSAHIGNTKQYLSYALNECNFSVPGDFSYSSYVYGLDNTISNFIKEINDIESKIRETDTSYSNLENGLCKNFPDDDSEVLSDRRRLIK